MAEASRRNYGLDLLRAVSILLVLANHAFLGFFEWYHQAIWTTPVRIASYSTFLSIEWLFVLSGFLIGTMMIRSFEAGSSWWQRAKSFWLRRWFRTMPNYYLFLVVNIILGAIGIGMGRFSVQYLLFAQNLAWKEGTPLFYNEAWSLALDEWFYVLMPILVGLAAWVLRLKPRTAFLVTALTLIAAPAILRYLHAPPTDIFDADASLRRVTIYHLDATGWGVLGAITSRWWPGFWERRRATKAIIGGALVVLGTYLVLSEYFGGPLFATYPRVNSMLTFTLPAAGTVLALPWIASLRPRGGLFGWSVDRISLYSYSIYLTHIPVMFVMRAGLDQQGSVSAPELGVVTVFWLAFTFAVAVMVFRTFEKPVSDLRERFTRKVDANPFEAKASTPPAPPS